MRSVVLFLVAVGFVVLQFLIGGTRPIYVIPGAMLFGIAVLASAWPGLLSARKASPACLIGMLVFLGYVLVWNRLSPIGHIGKVQFYAAGAGLLVYLLTVLVLDRSKERRWLIFVLLGLAMFQTGVGVVQFGHGNQWMPLDFLQRSDDTWRASGLYISPNHFAGFLEVAALMAFSLMIWGKNRPVTRIGLGYVGISCMAGVAISGSRGGYLSTATGLLTLLCLTLWVVRKLRPERFLPLALGAVGAIALLVGVAVSLMLAVPTVKNRLQNTFETTNMRLLMWKSSLQQFQIAPVTGTGAATFLYYGRQFRDPSVQNDPIHVHNDYLQLLAEYGIIGAALFLAVFVLHLRAGFRGLVRLSRTEQAYYDARDNGLAICIGAISSLAAYTVHSVVDFNMQIPANTALMAFVLGILCAPTMRKKGAGSTDGISKAAQVAMPVLGLGVIAYGGMMLPGEWCSDHARRALRNKQPEEALQWAEKGIARSKSDPDLYYYAGEAARALAAFDKGQSAALLEKSVGYFQKGLEVFPQDSRLMFKLAHAQSDAGDYAAATTTLEAAEEWDPKSAYLPAYHGLVEQGAGYYEQALDYYEQAHGNEIAIEGRAFVQKILKAQATAQKATQKPPQGAKPAEASAAGPEPTPSAEPVVDPGEPKPFKPVLNLEDL
jgi:O-antigen ligase